MSAARLLSVRGLRVSYSGAARPAVDGVDLDLAAGEVLALVGESGSGKTSLALALGGLLPAAARVQARSIDVVGRELAGAAQPEFARARGRELAYSFQDSATALDPLARIGSQVAEGPRWHEELDAGAAGARALEELAAAGFADPASVAARFPHELSGGMRQRASIAAALASRSRILIADEPTSALDSLSRAHVLAVLRRLARERGLGVLLITHDLASAARAADRAAVMREGRVVEVGGARELFARPQHPYTASLVAAHAARGRGGPALRAEEPMVDVRGLRVTFGGRALAWSRRRALTTAVDDVSLSILPGETLALVGASGAGKSTLARALVRLVEAERGEIWLRCAPGSPPVDLCRLTGRALRAARRAIGIVFQDPSSSLDPRWSVARTLSEPLRLHGLAPRSEQGDRVAALLRDVRLPPEFAWRFPHELSGGELQRVAIARALAARPALLVCDEILSSLDAWNQAHVLDLLAELRERAGLALAFVSHDLRVVRGFAHRVAVLEAGRVVEEGEPERLFADPRHPQTRALVDAARIEPGADPLAQLGSATP